MKKHERYVPYKESIDSELRKEQEKRAVVLASAGVGGDPDFIATTLAREPDIIQWTDWMAGYPCLIKRNDTTGNLCGYVIIPKQHMLCRAHGKRKETAIYRINVHGGVTLSEKDVPTLMRMWGPITWDNGKNFPGNVSEYKRGMVVGFDTVHHMDRMLFMGDYGGVYRDVKYVKREVRRLAQQLKVMEKSLAVKCHLLGSN